MEAAPELAPFTPTAFSPEPGLSNDPPNHDKTTLLEQENKQLRRRLREAEKEVMDQRNRLTSKTQPLSASTESRRRSSGSEVNEEALRRALDNRDGALLELRRQLQMLKMRLGKEEEEEEEEEDLESEDIDGGTIHTGDTSYESAEDDEGAGPVRE